MTDFYNPQNTNVAINDLIKGYAAVQANVVAQMQALGSDATGDNLTPGKFMLLQMQVAQVTQVGDSVSAVISQINSVTNTAIRGMKQN